MEIRPLDLPMDQHDLEGLEERHRARIEQLAVVTNPDKNLVGWLTQRMKSNRFMAGPERVTEIGMEEMFRTRSDLCLLLMTEPGIEGFSGYALASTSPRLPTLPHPDPDLGEGLAKAKFKFIRRSGREDTSQFLYQAVVGKGDGILIGYGVEKQFRGSGRSRTLIAGVRACARFAGCDRLVAFVSGSAGRRGNWDREASERLREQGFGEFATVEVGGLQHCMQVALPPYPGRWSREKCEAVRYSSEG